MAIWEGRNNHQQPFPGDHDIQVAPVPGSIADRPGRRPKLIE